MKLSDKIDGMTVVEFTRQWCRGNPEMSDFNSIVVVDWANLQDQTVAFLDQLEKEDGKS